MPQPFGHTLNLRLAPARVWLKLGPGWMAVAGLLSAGAVQLEASTLLQAASLWLLVDPLLGTLWELSVTQGLWRRVRQAQLPPPPRYGFALPYAQLGSPAGNFSLWLRRYRRWWEESYWPEAGQGVVTFGVGGLLALLLAFWLGLPLFWLALLALLLIILAGADEADLGAAGGGRWQTLVQIFIPGLMGLYLGSRLDGTLLAWLVCFSGIYLGGLRWLGGHARAEWLFFLGQLAVVFLLLAQRLLLSGALVLICLLVQALFRTRYPQAAAFLPRIQPYLVLSLLAAAFSLGNL